MIMSILHYLQLAGAVFIFSMAIFVFRKNPYSDTHIGFSIATLATSLWLIFYFMAFAFVDPLAAHLYFRIH